MRSCAAKSPGRVRGPSAVFVVGLAVLVDPDRPGGSEACPSAFFAVGFVPTSGLGLHLAWPVLRSGPAWSYRDATAGVMLPFIEQGARPASADPVAQTRRPGQ
jgi:hypothetical protein